MNQAGDSRENELQRLLSDERNICNQYKQIYQALKENYRKVQDELKIIHDQLKEKTALNEKLISSSEADARKLQAQVKDQQNEISTLVARLKVCDEKKNQAVVLEEATTLYEARIRELNLELDKVHDQYSNLHYENAILKCKLESREAEFSRTLERISLQHQSEIEQLKNKIEALEKKENAPAETFAVELKTAKREVLQLNSKVKTLLAECEELRSENENLSLQLSGAHRINTKQAAEHATNIRILESEKLKAVTQTEILEKELTNAQEHRRVLNGELQSSRREVMLLKGKVDDCEHTYRVTVANLQVDMEQWKASKEAEGEQFADEVTKLKSELQARNTSLNNERQSMVSKEQELQQNLATSRQQLWRQSKEITELKEKYESQVRTLETERDDLISQLQLDVQVLTQKLQSCVESKKELEKEILTLKNRHGESATQLLDSQSHQPTSYNFNYQKEIQELREKINQLATVGIPREEPNIEKVHTDNEIVKMKLGWEQQKLQFQQRLEELESQLREYRSTSTAEKRDLEFKVKQYTRQVSKLREKLELQRSQNEELEVQNEALEKNVAVEVHLEVKNQLTELRKRLEEYQVLISADPDSSSKHITTVPLPEKLLVDIKNIQHPLTLFPKVSTDQIQFLPNTKAKEVLPAKVSPKKSPYSRRKSLKSRERKSHSKSYSPIISSSTDIDRENL